MRNKGLEFVEELFETALEYVQTKEHIEEEHVSLAHNLVEDAIEQERALENCVRLAHHDAEL